MSLKDQVKTIMTTDVRTIEVSAKLKKAEEIIKKYKIRHLPVVKGPKLVGIIGRTDLLRMSFVDEFGEDEAEADNAIYEMLTIDQVMVNKPVTVQSNQSIREAAEILTEKKFHALPVLEGENLVGMVSTTDLIQYLLNTCE